MNKKISLLLAGLVLLPGCIHVPEYNRRSMRFIDESCNYHEVKNSVAIRAKRLTENNKKEIFGESSKQLSKAKNGSIEVVYLSLHNLTKNTYGMSYAGIGMPIMPYSDIVPLMKTSTAGRAAGMFGLFYGSSIATPALLGVGILAAAHGVILGIPMVIAGGVLGVTTLVTLFKNQSSVRRSMKMNNRIATDLAEKTMFEGVILEPGDKYEGLVFVRSCDYTSRFSVLLTQQYHPDSKLIFDVDLLQAPHTYGVYNE